ncbi:MAG: CcoQ/FixQ family Cbb3-type cytochrome c oxidase assembly chaperone [Chitinophagaceae bacterium]|nr:CcoQ/FixQ family Cbb3-type cytochrome c oxidase assembly chaperone [Chitinophagaceae bacterium]
MFKFIKQYTETMKDAAIYPIISLFIFIIFFTVLLIMVKNMKKETVTKLSNIPFENNETSNSNL